MAIDADGRLFVTVLVVQVFAADGDIVTDWTPDWVIAWAIKVDGGQRLCERVC